MGNLIYDDSPVTMKKKMFIILCLCLATCIFSSCTKDDKSQTITGDEWLIEQQDRVTEYKEIIKSTEDVYTLYISENMAQEDFNNEIKILNESLLHIINDYNTDKGNINLEHNIDNNILIGIQGLENLFNDTQALYTSSINKIDIPFSPLEVSYIYINYKDKIIADYSEYMDTVSKIKGDSNINKDKLFSSSEE